MNLCVGSCRSEDDQSAAVACLGDSGNATGLIQAGYFMVATNVVQIHAEAGEDADEIGPHRLLSIRQGISPFVYQNGSAEVVLDISRQPPRPPIGSFRGAEFIAHVIRNFHARIIRNFDPAGHEGAAVIGGICQVRDHELARGGKFFGELGLAACLAKNRQEHTYQQSDNPNDNQQFDECKSPSPAAICRVV